MKVDLNSNICTINQYKQKLQNIAFSGHATTNLSGDSLEKSNSAKSLFENILIEFSDKINLEKDGNKIKIPNCIMFETKNKDIQTLPVEWVKKTADCNFVYLADRNNDELADALWEELKKSKDVFEQTNRRTAIHVEGFDRLITSGQNSFENIDSIKDIMSRTAKDFGATIIFSTKDASKLTSEAIQPQRVTKFVINSSNVELEKYNTFLDSRGYFKDYKKRIASKTVNIPKSETRTVVDEIPSKQEKRSTSKTENKKPEVRAQQDTSGKIYDRSEIPTPQKPELTKSNTGGNTPLQRQSSEQQSSSDSLTRHKNLSEIKPKPSSAITQNSQRGCSYNPSSDTSESRTNKIKAKTIDEIAAKNNAVKNTAKKSEGSKTLKIISVLTLIGASIASVVYYIKNNQTQKSDPKSNVNKNEYNHIQQKMATQRQ